MEAHIVNAWAKDVDTITHELDVDLRRGLSRTEVVRRQKEYGPNTFGSIRGRSWIALLLGQFANALIMLLIIAAAVTLFFGEWLDAGVIVFAAIISVALGFYQEYKAERATAALHSYIETRVRILREGREHEVGAHALVPGDVIILTAGDRVPADARITKVLELKIDESILTGESMPIQKQTETCPASTLLSERTNMVFGGTSIVEGQAHAVVVATGLSTEFGAIAKSVLTQPEEKTPLQRAISRISWTITGIAVVAIASVYAIGLARGLDHLELFLIAVAIAVGGVPEALPPGLTAVLAVGVSRIAKRKGIVRSLLAAETLGSATVIITDKTGTLTEGRMKLVDTIATDEFSRYYDGGTFGADHASLQDALLRVAVHNSVVTIENPEDAPDAWVMSGRVLEKAIVQTAGSRMEGVPHVLAGVTPVKLFNSTDKYSITRARIPGVVPLAHTPSDDVEIAVGAPDILLRMSSMERASAGKIEACIDTLGKSGKRLVAVAVRPAGAGAVQPFNFLGVLLFYDPLREGMKQAVSEIIHTGVRVVMATGDLPGTAQAIAEQLGWDIAREEILTGNDVHAMDDAELQDAVARTRIFARMTPEEKHRLIVALQTRGEVVAMLGDGVNDAPSIKRANIGVALGSGSDVSKGVADLVLLNDDFRTVTAAIGEGRLILANVRKIFMYLISDSLDEIFLLGGSIVLGLSLPLTALQVIWVNLFNDSFPAIAFAFDIERPSRQHTKSVINHDTSLIALGIGGLSSFLLLALYLAIDVLGNIDDEIGRTFIFACFSGYTTVLVYSIRNIHKPLFTYRVFSNWKLNLGVAIGLSLTLATVYVPAFQYVFKTVSLPLPWFFGFLGWLVFNIALVELAKHYLMKGRRHDVKR